MRDDARIQAAILILEGILNRGEAADRALQAWGRSNRFAGSKDRRAIADHVYAALRNASCGDPRRAMIDALRQQNIGIPAIEALFSGERHAPVALSEDERTLLHDDTSATTWLDVSLRRRFGDATASEIRALSERAPLDLRVNALKAMPERAMDLLAEDGVVAEPVAGAPSALRVVAGSADVESSAAYEAGLVEIQDAGSQMVCALAGVRPGMAVLDLCTGAGGKALAFAAAMANRGRVVAADIAPVRLKRLAPRARRAGATIIEPHLLAPDWLDGPPPFDGLFDRVVIDAPCSGSGTWRRNPETRLRLTPARLAELAALQRRLLEAAAPQVKPGGRLLFITCSVLPEEGEDVAAAFAAAHPGFVRGPGLALSPASSGTDGFFAAAFDRTA
ncbi:MAG: RsmB/NOP family class I SAM-dependent RNA methyltransferase [Alphaproteobacteria bacterium]|nr:RsmB/NOP family class I SAM-dependent RNA methyltransferase [Alphaproteobacteria bacterium]